MDTNGIITTFAGNGLNSITGDGRAPTLAGIGFPVDVAFDAVENMYIADHGAAPAVPTSFTLDGSGSGPAIVVAVPVSGDAHLVNTLNPAHGGDTIVIYCTGLGGVDSSLDAGDAAPISPLAHASDPISVTVGGQAAQVAFAGLVPEFTGLYQINAVLPPD